MKGAGKTMTLKGTAGEGKFPASSKLVLYPNSLNMNKLGKIKA